MPTITLTLETLDAVGVSYSDLQESTLAPDVTRVLEGMLVSRGFDVTRAVHVIVLATGEGVVLAQ